MKHWTEEDFPLYADKGIVLNGNKRVLMIATYGGEFHLREQCDDYFSTKMSREDLVDALEEALEWVKNVEMEIGI